MSSWWMKKLLRYGLQYTGLFDDGALNLDDFNIRWGMRTVVNYQDIALNSARIGELLKLPPSLRVETARVASLRLTVPADLYHHAVEAEVDGLEVVVKLVEGPEGWRKKETPPATPPVTPRSPQHRKAHRRIRSPPPSRQSDFGRTVHIPTAEELAKSFLLDEPVDERRALEAALVADASRLDESILTENSDSGDVGTGAPASTPGVLAGFINGFYNRIQARLSNVEIKVETNVAGESHELAPVTLRLKIGMVESKSVATTSPSDRFSGRRSVEIQDVSIDLLSDATTFSQLSEVQSSDSPTMTKHTSERSSVLAESESRASSRDSDAQGTSASFHADTMGAMGSSVASETLSSNAESVASTTAFRQDPEEPIESDIKAGDDNISWGSRQSQASAVVEDLWSSMASEDDLPESMLLDRAPTPRQQSPVRNRRAVSPYDRSFYSPGSWPRLEQSPERQRSQRSPGSWPMPDQSQHSMYQPLTPGPALELEEDPMDNKRTALEASVVSDAKSEASSHLAASEVDREDSPLDELAESRFYSHEEAESLYMSAMTQGSAPKVPGGWGSEGSVSDRPPSSNDERDHEPVEDRSMHRVPVADGQNDFDSGNVTPRARSPLRPAPTTKDDLLESKQLLSIDHVSLWLPSLDSSTVSSTADDSPYRAKMPVGSPHQNMPGAFSMYSETAASRLRERPSALRDSRISMQRTHSVAAEPIKPQQVDVQVGCVVSAVDLASCRLLYRAVSAALDASIDTNSKPPNANEKEATPPPSAPLKLELSVKQLRLSLVEHLTAGHASTQDVGLIALSCTETSLSTSPGYTEVRLGKLQAWMSGSELIAFDRASTLGDSMLLTEATPDIVIKFSSTKVTVQDRPVNELVFELLPLKLSLDLSALDDTLGSFGGLSGVLELSSSFMSEGGPLGSPSITQRSAKGVRFAGEPEAAKTGPELKINVRISGAHVTLRGETSAVTLRSSTLKLIYREHAASVTAAHILLTGPHLPSEADPPISADLATLRLDYLVSPTDTDLERLLTLLTPSKDKYDNDDDILLDTLLRQRRKGGLARVCLEGVKLKVADWGCMDRLTALGAELAKLSVVTKYLPEDDRPGLLSLIRIKGIQTQLPVNENFGMLKLNAREFHCAHVGLPALLALSFDSVKAVGPNSEELLHPLIPLAAGEALPMIMARMLGNEAEPSIKIKIFNTCFEYSVPMVVALTGTSATNVEGLVSDLAQSVADLTVRRKDSEMSTPVHGSSQSSPKRTNIDLLIHESALGLTPEKSGSKGLLVLSDVRFGTMVPPATTTKASLQLRKAAIFVVDDRHNDVAERTSPTRGTPSNTVTSARLSAALAKQGFVSVGSIMAAKIDARIEQSNDSASKSVTVDVSNDLLLLETCADSTQTLFAVLGGLAPPTPPSKQPKYHTEPMTIEDMMASFTGEPVPEPTAPSELLFDVEEEVDDDPGMLLDASTLGGRADDLLMESEMTSSLYGPVSGMLGGLDRPDAEDEMIGADDYDETVESLLEDDPFEMPLSPTDAGLGDSALLRDLAKQCKPAVSGQSAELGQYEIEDLGLDALGPAGGEALGSAHRFNAPTRKGRKLPVKRATDKLPFRLRLRDTHIIWNIYDGYDWQHTRDGITQVVEQVEAHAEERKARRRRSHNVEDEEEPVISDFLFNSIYVGVTHDAQELRRQINRGIDDMASETESVPMSGMSRPTAYSASGRPLRQQQRRRLKLERSKAHKVAFELKGVSADLLVYPSESKEAVSDLDLRVRDLEIFDNVPTSTWRKFLTCLEDGPKLREMSKPMAHIEVNTVRTLEDFAASELIIHASILPLRLHVDQDALDFIVRFFEFKDDRTMSAADPAEQPFIQRLEVDTVDLRLDYKPKRIDYGGLRSGHTTELMNMISLDAANIRLMHAIIYGIRGFEPLHKTLNDIWMPDVKRNQLPTVLAGLAPVRSLVNIGTGMRDVVAIPIREYKKDGRIVRSIQKGALHFGKTTTSELARLGAKLAIGTQNILQGAEGLLSPPADSPSGSRPGIGRRASSEQGWHDIGETGDEEHEQRAISAYANQPLGVLSGLRSARLHLEHDLLTARDALIAVQGEILESGNPGAVAAAVARHAPTVILRPVIGASRAVGTTLLGVGNQIDRKNMKKVDDKYKRR